MDRMPNVPWSAEGGERDVVVQHEVPPAVALAPPRLTFPQAWRDIPAVRLGRPRVRAKD